MRQTLLLTILLTMIPATLWAQDTCPDWASAQDKATGKTYYYNKQTKKTTWTNPCAPCASWLSITDGATNKTYYHNRATRTSTWTRPPGCFILSAPKNTHACLWESATDAAGKTYYFHTKTRKTSWDRPSCLK